MDEFDLIDRWCRRFPTEGPSVRIGVGDDAAVVRPGKGKSVVATTDALVAGVHFDERRFPPPAVGHKALAANLSDLAAMGARPRWLLVSLALPPRISTRWLDGVASGMAALARKEEVVLVGGNVSRGYAVALHLTLLGEASGRVLTRAGGKAGDAVLVSGTLGDAALGLASLETRSGPPPRPSALEKRQLYPTARTALGRSLARLATACIDVSDGLAADLGHLAAASGVRAEVDLERLPLSTSYRRAAQELEDPVRAAVTGGEDYELIVAVPRARVTRAQAAARRAGTQLTEIGRLVRGRGVRIHTPRGGRYDPGQGGWRHL